MDIDPNDLLSTNTFIDKPNLNPNVSIDNVEEFKKYYEKESKDSYNRKLQTKVSLTEMSHNENNDEQNTFFNFDTNKNTQSNKSITRDIKHLDTLVSIDSRDRTKSIDPKASNFTIFLGKTFRNVKKIELVSLEFPNTDAVINTGNNMIYWINKEDIDQDITVTVKGVVQYPIYSASITVGSYTANSLQSEILTVVNKVIRRQGTENGGSDSATQSKYHFFVITLNINTDLVTFDSLIMQNLNNNAFSTTGSSGIIQVTSIKPHGYIDKQQIYIYGSTQIAGIESGIINGFHYITYISATVFNFTVNVQATITTTGGGNTIQTGRFAPFQFLWGTQTNTIAQNIGYPLENSSQLITTNIRNSENIFQMIITTVQDTGFKQTYYYVGQTISVGYIFNGSFTETRVFQITDIVNTTTILVQVEDNSVYESLNSSISTTNKIQFGTDIFDVYSFTEYLIPSFLINTQTFHNYILNNIGNTINLSNTETYPDGPNNDFSYTISQLPTPTSIIVPGVLTYPINNGTIPRQNPLTTWTVIIKQIDRNYLIINSIKYSRIITNVPHLLKVGDSVYFNNVVSVPNLIKSYIITSVPTSTSFQIQLELGSIDNTSITNGTAFIGTSLITVSFPSHGFNNIISVSNGPVYPVITNTITIINQDNSTTVLTGVNDVTSGSTTLGNTQGIIVHTLNSHNLSVNNKVRLTFLNQQPLMTSISLTGGGYTVIQIINADTFVMINKTNAFSPLTTIPSSLNGMIGLSNDFYLYGVKNIGGIDQSLLNSIKFSVRDIYDTDTFTFICNSFSKSTENGGGSEIYISSLLHGFDGKQSNTKNKTLNRSINLQGENYSFLTCPVLNTMLNTGTVNNVFARISLDQPPGYVCFSFLSNPKIFDIVPLSILEQLTFSIYNYNNSLYEFNDIDFSFCLKITESIDYTTQFNISSRRGITDTTTSK